MFIFECVCGLYACVCVSVCLCLSVFVVYMRVCVCVRCVYKGAAWQRHVE